MGTLLSYYGKKTILLPIVVAQKLEVYCFENLWPSPLLMCAIFVPTGCLIMYMQPSSPNPRDFLVNCFTKLADTHELV